MDVLYQGAHNLLSEASLPSRGLRGDERRSRTAAEVEEEAEEKMEEEEGETATSASMIVMKTNYEQRSYTVSIVATLPASSCVPFLVLPRPSSLVCPPVPHHMLLELLSK